MGIATNIFRRKGSANYYCRVVVPLDLIETTSRSNADFFNDICPERAFRKAEADRSINLRQAAAPVSTPPGDLVDLNFKLDAEFRKTFKIRATRAGLTNREFIRAAFQAYCEKFGD